MYVEEKKPGETNIDNVGNVLLETADYIERHGWCQKKIENKFGAVCIMGELCRVPKLMGLLDKVNTKLRRFIPRLPPHQSIHHWNDAPGRTKEQVVAALRGRDDDVALFEHYAGQVCQRPQH